MRYIWEHINNILDDYSGSLPLSHYLKHYFKRYPKLGSRDRRILSDMAYSWYRCSKGVSGVGSVKDKILVCLQLCNCQQTLLNLKAEPIVEYSFDIHEIFTVNLALSDGITKEEWLSSHLQLPDMFIRLRVDKKKIEQQLEAHQISYRVVSPTCFALKNGTKMDGVLPENWYVVQDASSQETGAFFDVKSKQKWYDCCSGAGGKTLLLLDKQRDVDLTVSDIRASILHNLRERVKKYGHHPPECIEIDLSAAVNLPASLKSKRLDGIIADVPCSGSGTWARTPEQLYYCDIDDIKSQSERQRQIIANILPLIKPSTTLYYITCSVFKAENDDNVSFFQNEYALKLVNQKLINGVNNKADSMFIAEFTI